MRRRGGMWRVSALGLGIALAAPAAFAQAPVPGAEVARATFEEGVALEKSGDYAGALAKFNESAKIRETSGVLFHRAYCMEMSKHDLALTVEAYEKADRVAKAGGQATVQAAVKRQLAPLTARLAHLTITVSPPHVKDLEVWLDGRVAPLALLGKPFRADPGEHNVEAKAPGFKPYRKLVKPGDGATLTVDIRLEPAPGATAVTPATAAPTTTAPATRTADEPPSTIAPPAEDRARDSATLPILLTTGAVVLAGVGVGAFVAAGSKQESARADCAQRVECEDLRRSVGTLDALALTAWIGAAGLGTWATIAWLSRDPAPTSPAALTSARFGVGPLGLSLSGSWR
jgi:hypothetical protein